MFAPIHLKTRFSPLGSLLTPEQVVGALRERRITACAVRDDASLHGAYAVRAAAREHGISVAIGVDLPVSFEGRAGDRFPATVGLLAIGPRGETALNRIVRSHWARSPRILRLEDLRGDRDDIRIVLSSSDGPILACLEKGRLADAWRIASAIHAAGGDRVILEIGRTGRREEELTEPFYREMASRFEMTLVASAPVRYLRKQEADVLSIVRSVSPADSCDIRGQHMPSSLAMRRRYGSNAPVLEQTVRVAEESAGTTLRDTNRSASRDRFLKCCLAGVNARYGSEPKWRRDEITSRFWREYWKLEEDGALDFVIALADLIRRVEPLKHEYAFRVRCLEGTLIASLLGWTTLDPIARDLHPVEDRDDLQNPVVEGNQAFLRTLRSLLTSSRYAAFSPAIQPQALSREDRRLLSASLTSAGKGAGQDPKNRSTHSLFEPHNRTNERPVPSERMHALLETPFVTGYEVASATFSFAGDGACGWSNAPEKTVSLRPTMLHEVLYQTRDLEPLHAMAAAQPPQTETRTSVAAEVSDWVALLLEKPCPEFRDRAELRTMSDWILLLQTSDDAVELRNQIAKIRAGELPKPVVGSRINELLLETEGIPIYREQFTGVVRRLAGYSEERAMDLVRRLSNEDPRMLARDRHDFVAAVVEQGGSSLYGDRVFSFLLATAERSIPRARYEETVRQIRRVLDRASSRPGRFWTRLMNGLQQFDRVRDRKRKREWMALSVREGVRWLPVSINESGLECEECEDGVLRPGLSGIPGLSREEARAILEERSRGGNYRSAKDFIDRLVGSAITRPVLVRLARSLQDEDFRIERRGVRRPRRVRKESGSQEAAQVSLPLFDAVS